MEKKAYANPAPIIAIKPQTDPTMTPILLPPLSAACVSVAEGVAEADVVVNKEVVDVGIKVELGVLLGSVVGASELVEDGAALETVILLLVALLVGAGIDDDAIVVGATIDEEELGNTEADAEATGTEVVVFGQIFKNSQKDAVVPCANNRITTERNNKRIV